MLTPKELLIHLLAATLVGLLSARYAKKKEKNPTLWFFVGFVFGLLGFIFIFFLPFSKKKPLPPEPTLAGPTDKFWYYLDPSHQKQGPMSHAALTQAWRNQTVHPSTLIWHEDLTDWTPLEKLIKN